MSGQGIAESAPLIVAGMHRSGTTLLASTLHALGVRMGDDAVGDLFESRAFLELNESLLRQHRATWARPEPFLSKLRQPAELEKMASWLAGRLRDSPVSGDWAAGIGGIPWGWKDPRNTLTLPVWLEVFPRARVLAIVRNGVDVAASLTKRHREQRAAMKPTIPRRLWWLAKPHLPFHTKATPPTDVRAAFRLWEIYLECLERHLESVAPERTLVIRFESWLEQPESHLEKIRRFLADQALRSDDSPEMPVLRADRRYVFQTDPLLREIYEQVRDRPSMKRYDYDRLEKP